MAMGTKLLWRLITGEFAWCESAVWKKYFFGPTQRCLDSPPKVANSSPIFKLLTAAIPFIREKLTWIPGNGRHINLWDDKILGRDHLSSRVEMAPLRA